MRLQVFFVPMMVLVLLCASPNAAALSGRVVSSEGEPLIGVSVVTNVAGVGAVTDSEGWFELPDNDEISRVTFSSVGFTSRQFSAENIPDKIVLDARYYRGTDILVTADRADPGRTSIAFDNFSADEIKRDYAVGEFPLLLDATTNVHAFVDAGSALGFGSVRIRGFDDKRIVTYINGVPLNDPEDQLTYFVDLPDFASNVSDIQVQRGVGNSLYGDASFGGTINVVTDAMAQPRRVSVSAGYGEYHIDGAVNNGIYKQTIEYASGLIDGQYAFGSRFSKQKSDGYRRDSWYDGWSYYLMVGRLDPRMSTELHVFGGPIKYHAAWYGSSREALAQDRRVNVGIPGWDDLTYSNATDNFNQPQYHLYNTYQVNEKTTLRNTVYYIRGKGYYEQLKPFQTFADYGIDSSLTGGNEIGDLVRQLWVEKNQYGWNPRLDIEHDRGLHSVGGSFYYFESDHYGQVVWAQHLTGSLDPRHRYHNYFGKKYVGSIFGQEQYELNEKLIAQITAQLRYQKYSFDQVRMGAFPGYKYDLDYLFFSPRMGVSYAATDKLNLFANLSVASRTPTDKAIFDGDDPSPTSRPNLEVIDSSGIGTNGMEVKFGDPLISSERLIDLELGGQYKTSRFAFGLNLYWMDFSDMIVAEGGVTDGIANSMNVEGAVYSGIEFTAAWTPLEQLSINTNFAFNHNRITDFVQTFDYAFDTVTAGGAPDTLYESVAVDLSGHKVGRFPEILGNLIVDYHRENFRLTYRGRFIGRQYAELFNVEELSIDPVYVSSVSASLSLGNLIQLGKLTLSGRIDNMFNQKYESAVAYAEDFAFRLPNESAQIDGWSTYYVASELSFFTQVQLELF